MTGVPTFTDRWAEEYQRLRGTVLAAMTAARSHVKYAKIVAAEVTVAALTGHRIIINPAGDDKPAIWLIPASGGGNVSKIRSLDTVYPGEAVLSITSGVNQAGTASAELQLGSESVRMQIRDPDGTGNNGGFADWGSQAASFGYRNDGGSQNYFRFGENICRHFGKWDDYGSLASNAGLLWGSTTIGGSNLGWIIVYPHTMDSNMGPIIGFRPGSTTDGKVEWAITASSNDRYTVSWSIAQSVAIYQCSFRH
ncbi:hypothetical protein IMZ11_33650 [Microtetraspora sp. AC03309]|uniref:hypothetical protein n=1 Tax=Microtetraspora sp. AC03309 TaxID=2779376 RepID=UPI001E3277D2|nr:hypothetical protein [Microtetraspora sp. AC03309]MCC5580574.1 hypothetical protein [Microtetraspora sp. AC03309]